MMILIEVEMLILLSSYIAAFATWAEFVEMAPTLSNVVVVA